MIVLTIIMIRIKMIKRKKIAFSVQIVNVLLVELVLTNVYLVLTQIQSELFLLVHVLQMVTMIPLRLVNQLHITV